MTDLSDSLAMTGSKSPQWDYHYPLLIVFALLSSFTIIFPGCIGGIAYEKDYSIEEASWDQTDTLNFQFEIDDTTVYHDVFMVFRIDNEYPFSNLYSRVKMNGPQGQRITELKSYELADKSGKWRGKSYGGLISFEYPIFKEMEFRKGKYELQLQQFMRIKSIPGIHDVGIKIVEGDPLL